MMSHAEKQDGLLYAILGYVFLYLNLNINLGSGVIPLLPNLVGYLFFLSMIRRLEVDCPELSLLKGFAQLLALASVQQFLPFLPEHIPLFGIVQLVIGVVSIYFHFQLVTNLATLVTQWGFPTESAHLLHLRTQLVILETLMEGAALLPDVNHWHSWAKQIVSFLQGDLAIVLFLTALRIVLCLYFVYKDLSSAPE